MRLCLLRSSLSALALAAATPILPAQIETSAPTSLSGLTPVTTDPIPIVLPEAPLDAVLQLIEMLTGRIVLRPQSLPGTTVHLEAANPMPPEQALLALETVLAMNGIGIAPLGDRFLKVMQLPNMRVESPELIEGSTLTLPPSGRIASKVFTLEFLRAVEFFPTVSNLLNPQLGGAVLFDKANAALITDSISTLQRIELLVNQLDRPVTAGMEPKFYSLQFAKASDLVNKMRTIMQGTLQQQMGSSTSFNADDRTNQVVVIADPRLHDFFDNLIAKLDVKADPNTRNEVIPLKHAAAPDVANLISQLVSGQNAASQRATGSVRPGQVANQPSPEPQAQPVATVNAGDLGVTSSEFSTYVTVLADERSNAVVVSGTVDDIRLIRELVEKVDVLLAQVRIEVVIVEVTLSNNSSTGIDTLGLQVENGRLIGFAASGPGFRTGGFDAEGNATGFTQIIRDGRGYDLTGIISLGSSATKSNANILSVPAIVTTHNKEARIFVGQETPVISSYLPDVAGGGTGGTAGYGYRSTVTGREVGIELKVTPLIGDDGSVQLEITQVVSDVLRNTTIDGNPQPIIGKRETESFVSVRNGEIIVLGGLQRDTTNRDRSRLGPIPIIGDLLGGRTRTNEKTDLIFFLRPVVLTNSAADNAEALRRIQGGPQERAVHRALNPDAPRDENEDNSRRAPVRRGPR